MCPGPDLHLWRNVRLFVCVRAWRGCLCNMPALAPVPAAAPVPVIAALVVSVTCGACLTGCGVFNRYDFEGMDWLFAPKR
jgi:hypothetical protein